MKQTPRVGLGVIIVNADGRVLVGKRINSHAPYYSIPGGKLEIGESFEAGARREVYEETGLRISEPQVIGVTNNRTTWKQEGVHFISVVLLVTKYTGTLIVREKEKCAGWSWVAINKLPKPHFEASKKAIRLYTEKRFY